MGEHVIQEAHTRCNAVVSLTIQVQINLYLGLGGLMKYLINNHMEKIREQVVSTGSSLDYISGKSFLLPLFTRAMRRAVKIKASRESLKIRLAKKCDLIRLEPLRETLENISLQTS